MNETVTPDDGGGGVGGGGGAGGGAVGEATDDPELEEEPPATPTTTPITMPSKTTAPKIWSCLLVGRLLGVESVLAYLTPALVGGAHAVDDLNDALGVEWNEASGVDVGWTLFFLSGDGIE